MRLRAELLNQNRSQSLKLHRELMGVKKKIENLVNAVAKGILPKEIVQDKLKKLREDQEKLELELAQGRVIAFPKINATSQFI